MRVSNSRCAALALAALVYSPLAAPPALAVDQPLTASQRRAVTRIRELKEEVEELMRRLPPEVQSDLRQELSRPPGAGKPLVSGAAAGVRRPAASAGREGAVLVYSDPAELMVFDLGGDGLDLGGRATIRVGGSEIETSWTRASTDDAFLMVDAVSLREAGFDLAGADGRRIQDRVLASDGLRLRGPDGRRVAITDPWQLLSLFDANNDGKVDRSDAAWPHLLLFTDADADGRADPPELRGLADGGVQAIALSHGAARRDARRNTLVAGTFTREDGTTGTVASVRLHR